MCYINSDRAASTLLGITPTLPHFRKPSFGGSFCEVNSHLTPVPNESTVRRYWLTQCLLLDATSPHGEVPEPIQTILRQPETTSFRCAETSYSSYVPIAKVPKEAKRLIVANDEYEKPKLTTVQALALMSVREAGCGREAKGWVYSGMSFRMACDLGLNMDSGTLSGSRESRLDDEDVDARRITFWGCFLFDKSVPFLLQFREKSLIIAADAGQTTLAECLSYRQASSLCRSLTSSRKRNQKSGPHIQTQASINRTHNPRAPAQSLYRYLLFAKYRAIS